MLLYKPVSVFGSTPDYDAALPPATYELCGDQGVFVAVGNRVSSLVYRGVWDKKGEKGSWNWSYMKSGDKDLTDPPLDLDYSVYRANLAVKQVIERAAK